MSSDWKTYKLAEIGRIVTGKTPKTADDSNFGGQIPFVTPTDMDGRKTISSTARYLTLSGASSVKGSIIPAGSVMVSCIGSDMGKSVLAGKDCVTNQQINSIVLEKGFDNEFVYYNLSMRKAEFQHLASGGSTMPILNKGHFSGLEIVLPHFHKQKQISGFLGILDDRIALLRETNKTLESIAQAIFKSWFVDFDPVRAKQEGREPEGMNANTAALFPDSFEESELGLIPKGWRVGIINDFCKIASGKRPGQRSETATSIENIPLYGGAGIMGFTSESLFDDAKILTGRVGTLGKMQIAYPPFWASDNVLVISPIENRSFLYCFHWLRAIDIHALNRGSTQPLLTQKDLGNQQGVLPSTAILDLFVDKLNPVYDKIKVNQAQAQTLAQLRDTLLPRLISGQLRLSDTKTFEEMG